MKYNNLILHFERFMSGNDRSVQWAKDAETLLDDIDEWDEMFDDIQEQLSLYRPEGGLHLVDEATMENFIRRILRILRGSTDET